MYMISINKCITLNVYHDLVETIKSLSNDLQFCQFVM